MVVWHATCCLNISCVSIEELWASSVTGPSLWKVEERVDPRVSVDGSSWVDQASRSALSLEKSGRDAFLLDTRVSCLSAAFSLVLSVTAGHVFVCRQYWALIGRWELLLISIGQGVLQEMTKSVWCYWRQFRGCAAIFQGCVLHYIVVLGSWFFVICLYDSCVIW